MRILFSLFILLLTIPVGAWGQGEPLPQAQCFATLRQEMQLLPEFQNAFRQMEQVDYSTVVEQLSPLYKTPISLGVVLDRPAFGHRVWGFGDPTGYTPPVPSPFPASTLADKWEAPLREHNYLEEYVQDGNGVVHFVSCGYVGLAAPDLSKVRERKHFYDGQPFSLLKMGATHKTWFTQNVSFDYEDKIFATWTRLFVLPKLPKDSYFSRYDITEAFPGRVVPDFSALMPDPLRLNIRKIPPQTDLGLQALIRRTGGLPFGGGNPALFLLDEDGRLVSASVPAKLLPPAPQGMNASFPFYDYYSAIQQSFPEFGSFLALEGVLKFSTLQQVLQNKEADEISFLWDLILDPRAVMRYSFLLRENGATPHNASFDAFLENEAFLDMEVREILKLKRAEEKEVSVASNQLVGAPSSSRVLFWGLGGGGVLLLGVWFVLWRRAAHPQPTQPPPESLLDDDDDSYSI